LEKGWCVLHAGILPDPSYSDIGRCGEADVCVFSPLRAVTVDWILNVRQMLKQHRLVSIEHQYIFFCDVIRWLLINVKFASLRHHYYFWISAYCSLLRKKWNFYKKSQFFVAAKLITIQWLQITIDTIS
jgi:hypothetical protein